MFPPLLKCRKEPMPANEARAVASTPGPRHDLKQGNKASTVYMLIKSTTLNLVFSVTWYFMPL